ncbi:MAG: ArsR family transcriptional regulator [Ferroplasma sp.]
MDDELWNILMALENNTRREMLKTLANYESYGLELSKMIGVSQQAVNKQLDILEKLGFISTSGSIPSSMGAPRKIYRSTGFSTIIIDYSKNFINIKKTEIDYAPQDIGGNSQELIDSLKRVNDEISKIDRERNSLIARKDTITGRLKEMASEYSPFYRKVINEYIDTLDMNKVADDTGIPAAVVKSIIEKFLYI